MMATLSQLSPTSRWELECRYGGPIPQDEIDAAYAAEQILALGATRANLTAHTVLCRTLVREYRDYRRIAGMSLTGLRSQFRGANLTRRGYREMVRAENERKAAE